MSDTTTTIENALRIPGGADVSRDLYAAAAAALAGKSPNDGMNPLEKMPSYAVDFHCQRFVMGNTVQLDPNTNEKIFVPTDDDEHLAAVYQSQWDGKAAVMKRLDTFLQDGTVVVWLEWITPKKVQAPPKPAHARTVQQLLDPRVPPASAGAIPEAAFAPLPTSIGTGTGTDPFQPLGDVALGGDFGDGYEDEPDWGENEASSSDPSTP